MITAVVISLILFSIGVFGVISRKDILRILISVSIILGSITLLLVALATTAASYSLVLFVWAVEAVEIIIAVAIFLYLGRSGKELRDLEHFRW